MINTSQSHRLAVQSYINNCQTPSMAPCGPAGNAADFISSNLETLSIPNNSSIATGDIPFTYAGWVNTSVSESGVLSKGESVHGYEFTIDYYLGCYRFYIDNGNGGIVTSTAASVGWNFVAVWHDPDANTLNISLNGNDPSTVSTNAPLVATAAALVIGGRQMDLSGSVYYMYGAIQNVGFWKRLLTSEERSDLYNSGTGRSYSSLDSSLKRNLVSWWALNETSGSRLDSHSANHLTDNNTVGYTTGIVPEVWHNPRTALMNWADGIVDIGGSALWNSMVCWPMIKGQNKGSGTVVYSLGGLGVYNGTIAGACSRLFDGIQIDAGTRNNGITTALNYAAGTASNCVMAVCKSVGTPSGYNYITSGGGEGAGNTAFLLSQRPDDDGIQHGFWGGSPIVNWKDGYGDRKFISASLSSGSQRLYVNGELETANQPDVSIATTNTFRIGSSVADGTAFGGIISFVAYFNTPMNEYDLNALYKETLGIGLNLP